MLLEAFHALVDLVDGRRNVVIDGLLHEVHALRDVGYDLCLDLVEVNLDGWEVGKVWDVVRRIREVGKVWDVGDVGEIRVSSTVTARASTRAGRPFDEALEHGVGDGICVLDSLS